MKIEIIEFGKDRTIHSFDTHKGCESVNVLVETDDEEDNRLLSFEEKDGKLKMFNNEVEVNNEEEDLPS